MSQTETDRLPEDDQKNMNRQPGVVLSLIPVVVMLGLLFLSLKYFGWDVQIPLLVAAVLAACLGIWVIKVPWHDLEKGVIESITHAMQAILICCLIGDRKSVV